MEQVMVTINPTLSVPYGDSCLLETKNIKGGRCWYYKTRACLLFNKVVVDSKKCPQCVELCNPKPIVEWWG